MKRQREPNIHHHPIDHQKIINKNITKQNTFPLPQQTHQCPYTSNTEEIQKMMARIPLA